MSDSEYAAPAKSNSRYCIIREFPGVEHMNQKKGYDRSVSESDRTVADDIVWSYTTVPQWLATTQTELDRFDKLSRALYV